MMDPAKKRRILLMYISKVSGHRQATFALQRALRKFDPHVQAPSINGFGYTYPLLEQIVNTAYMGVIRRTPKVWDYLYDNPKVVKRSAWIQKFLHKTSHAKIAKLFEQYHPDTVVCTQAFPCGMVADYKRTYGLKTLLVGVLTDYAPHSYWINEGVDYYIVPAQEIKDRFIAKGVAQEKIKVFGIPIRSKFAAALDKRAIAQKLGLNLDVPVVLIMGGGQGLGPIKDSVRAMMKLDMDLQLVVIAGTNKELLLWLKQAAKESPKKILCFEYADNVEELMEVSTVIVTKPGGMTTSESLAKGLPMIIINPIPGQEMRNTDFLLSKGIGIRIDNDSNIAEEIELLLKSPQRLAAMRRSALENGRPHAALDVAKLILEHRPPEAAPAIALADGLIRQNV